MLAELRSDWGVTLQHRAQLTDEYTETQRRWVPCLPLTAETVLGQDPCQSSLYEPGSSGDCSAVGGGGGGAE